MVLTFLDYEIIAGITNNFVDYEKIARITNYFGVEFLKISFYLNLFVKMEFFRQKERIQVIKYIYLLKKKKIKTETETEAGAHLPIPLRNMVSAISKRKLFNWTSHYYLGYVPYVPCYFCETFSCFSGIAQK